MATENFYYMDDGEVLYGMWSSDFIYKQNKHPSCHGVPEVQKQIIEYLCDFGMHKELNEYLEAEKPVLTEELKNYIASARKRIGTKRWEKTSETTD